LPVTFSIATAENLQVTLTDLQVPSALSSATIVVTQGDVVSGQATLAAPATSATFKINGAVGKYSLWVFGAPGANFSVGTFSACVAPQSNPSACIQSASISDGRELHLQLQRSAVPRSARERRAAEPGAVSG
jgi:hypothetical protein